jgi:hypothetical protein
MADVLIYQNLVTSEHKDKPNFMAMIAATVQGSVDLQNILPVWPSLFDVYTAVGDQLDKLGEWIGVKRNIPIPLTGVYFTWQNNSIPDADNFGGTWTHHGGPSGPLQFSGTGRGWVLQGNGAQQFDFWFSQGFPVVPGQQYLLEGIIDAASVISGNPSIGLYDNTTGSPNFAASGIAGAVQVPLTKSLIKVPVTIPPGVTNVVAIVDTFNAVVPVGKTLSFQGVSLQLSPFLGWGQGTWFSEFNNVAGLVQLPDDSYRVLLLSVISSNQWDGTIPGAYTVLDILYTLEGLKVLIQDNQNMSISIIILSASVSTVAMALLKSGFIALRPAGVNIAGYFKATTPVFGWGEQSDVIQGWGQGNWIQLSSF